MCKGTNLFSKSQQNYLLFRNKLNNHKNKTLSKRVSPSPEIFESQKDMVNPKTNLSWILHRLNWVKIDRSLSFANIDKHMFRVMQFDDRQDEDPLQLRPRMIKAYWKIT
jgi:hypothetical protein